MPDLTNLRLGKRAPRPDPRTLALASYLDLSTLPAPPPALDQGKVVKAWPMYANDRLGDCTCAAAGHMIELWSAMAGRPAVPSEADVIALYNRVNGGEDNGAVELDVLREWRKVGLGGDKITAFAHVNANSRVHIELAVMLFGGLYIGAALPLSAQRQVGAVWDIPAGGMAGEGQPGSWGGHAVNIVGYDPDGLTCITWGKRQRMTWAFWHAYVDEAWAILPAEFNGATIAGLHWDQLQADLALVGRVRR